MANRTTLGITALVVLCLVVEVALLSAGLPRPLLITSILGLTSLAVAVVVVWAMRLAGQPRIIKGLVVIPIVLSAGTIAVLILEAGFQVRGW